MSTPKVERDGSTAVVYSACFGGGWSTRYDGPNPEVVVPVMLHHPDLVTLVERGNFTGADVRLTLVAVLGKEAVVDVPYIGANSLVVTWVPMGTLFFISNYDGRETVHHHADGNEWHIA